MGSRMVLGGEERRRGRERRADELVNNLGTIAGQFGIGFFGLFGFGQGSRRQQELLGVQYIWSRRPVSSSPRSKTPIWFTGRSSAARRSFVPC